MPSDRSLHGMAISLLLRQHINSHRAFGHAIQ
jgi:hypothetical protein